MVEDIQRAMRLIMLRVKQREKPASNATGGLLVLLWNETVASAQKVNCAAAAAGPWCRGITMEAPRCEITDIMEHMFPGRCPEPDPEDLCDFADVHGSLKLLMSFQMTDTRIFAPECQARLKSFLHTFSLANAGIVVVLKFKFNQQTIQQEFRVKIKSKVVLADQSLMMLDVTCNADRKMSVRKGKWCGGGHPVLGTRLPLRIPTAAMDQGLSGQLTVQFVLLLTPCMLQYPNQETNLTRIQVLVYGPSNVPVTGTSSFLQNLPAYVDSQDGGLEGLHWSSFRGLLDRGGFVHMLEQEKCKESTGKSDILPSQQNLKIFLFLKHKDPFASQLFDTMASETMIEHHLEDTLNYNRQAVTKALQAELRKVLEEQNRRNQDQRKLHSAFEVVLTSVVNIVSSSCNMDFRNTCLDSMKVCDTHELSTAVGESLRRVSLLRFAPRGRCFSAQMEEDPKTEAAIATEI